MTLLSDPLLLSAGAAGLSLALNLLILALASRVPRLSGRASDLQSVQSVHTRLTPRIGGAAIVAAVLLVLLLTPAAEGSRLLPVLLAVTPLFLAGLSEDLGFHIAPQWRLAASFVSCLLAVLLIGAWLDRAGVPGVDGLLRLWPLGVPLTLLVVVGISNAFNLVDGMNGLFAISGFAAALCLSWLAASLGNPPLMIASALVAAAILGFFVLNFPFGLVFAGDAGAYTIGFVLAWLGILLVLQEPEVSPWAVQLLFFWPMTDMFVALWRRRTVRSAMLPDRLHMHQLVLRRLEARFSGRMRRRMLNPLTTLVLTPFVLAPMLAGVLLWNRDGAAFAVFVGCLLGFLAAYRRLVRQARR